MFNYLIKIEYKGSKFVGWQSQKNGISIQEKIEKALKKIFKIKIKINGAGRTDKGVHAYGQFANFFIDNKIDDKIKFLNSINFFLGKNLISIVEVKEKNKSFHARHSAKERIYEYQIINGQPFISRYTIYGYQKLHLMDKDDCLDYEYHFNQKTICCTYNTITKVDVKLNSTQYQYQDLSLLLINSLRNVPDDWTLLFNGTFSYVYTDDFSADNNNLKKTIDSISSIEYFQFKKHRLRCELSEFEKIQRKNDDYLLIALGCITVLCTVFNAANHINCGYKRVRNK